MDVTFPCPECGEALQTNRELVGLAIRCVHCRVSVVVPASAAEGFPADGPSAPGGEEASLPPPSAHDIPATGAAARPLLRLIAQVLLLAVLKAAFLGYLFLQFTRPEPGPTVYVTETITPGPLGLRISHPVEAVGDLPRPTWTFRPFLLLLLAFSLLAVTGLAVRAFGPWPRLSRACAVGFPALVIGLAWGMIVLKIVKR